MPDYFITVLVLVLVILLVSVLVSPRFKKWVGKKKTGRKHERAHAGKIKCEDPDCDDIAVAFTPNGYFCDWHFEPMSKKELPGGGYVVWHHDLYHAIRRS